MRKEKPVFNHTTGSASLTTTAFGLVALTAGCATAPPAQEMSDARQSLETAQTIGAQEHAPEVLGNAQQLLSRAQNDMQSGNYEQAQKEASAAVQAARQAVTISQAKQQAVAESPPPPEPLPETQIPLEPAMPAQYTIEHKDSLWGIAAKPAVYGDARLWPLLLKANADLIKSPDLIKPGTTLQIERNLSATEIDSALEYSRKRGDGPVTASDIRYLRQYGLR